VVHSLREDVVGIDVPSIVVAVATYVGDVAGFELCGRVWGCVDEVTTERVVLVSRVSKYTGL
jgi:hypothetical protein